MNEEISRKDTIQWLHIMLDHKTQDLKKLSEDISLLNHQIRYFNEMKECFQETVIEDLNNFMQEKHWNKKIK